MTEAKPQRHENQQILAKRTSPPGLILPHDDTGAHGGISPGDGFTWAGVESDNAAPAAEDLLAKELVAAASRVEQIRFGALR